MQDHYYCLQVVVMIEMAIGETFWKEECRESDDELSLWNISSILKHKGQGTQGSDVLLITAFYAEIYIEFGFIFCFCEQSPTSQYLLLIFYHCLL